MTTQNPLALNAPTSSREVLTLKTDVRVQNIAAQLRTLRSRTGAAQSVLFVPASESQACDLLVSDIARALQELREGPVLVVDLSPTDPDLPVRSASLDPLTESDPLEPLLSKLAESADSSTVAFAKLNPRKVSILPVAESISLLLTQARRTFGHILLVGRPLSSNVHTTLAAPMCDAAILSVTRGVTTYPEISQAKSALANSGATLLGFVFDEGSRPVSGK